MKNQSRDGGKIRAKMVSVLDESYLTMTDGESSAIHGRSTPNHDSGFELSFFSDSWFIRLDEKSLERRLVLSKKIWSVFFRTPHLNKKTCLFKDSKAFIFGNFQKLTFGSCVERK